MFKTMYRVEKFLPAECPKCRTRFQNQNEDWELLLGDVVNGRKVVRETAGYDVIVCAHCQNHTARFLLETCQLFDRRKAEDLVEKEGFVNLTEVRASGTMAVDSHEVHTAMPGRRVVGVTSAGATDR